MKQVIGISLGERQQDFTLRTELLGQKLQVRRLGTDGDVAEADRLLHHWDTRADAIGLGLAKDSGNLADGGADPRRAARLRAKVRHAPFSNGTRLADILLEWAVRHAQSTLGHYFDNARVLFFSGLAHQKLALSMAEYTPNLHFADPVLQLGSPKLLTSLDALGLYASGMHYVADWVPRQLVSGPLMAQWAQYVLKRAVCHATVLVAPVHQLDALGLEELAGKTLITHTVNAARLAAFKDKGVHLVIDAAPLMQGHAIDPSLFDAMLLAASGRHGGDLVDDDYLEILGAEGLQPRLLYPGGFKRVNRFAFVIHPLSQEYFKKVKPVEVLSRVSPPLLMDSLEKVMAYAPPFVYSRVEGIRSPTGVEAEGWLIAVGGTPKEIMNHSPEFTYRRLLAAADMARKLGAQIMGLGAFTKVVGDAGVTVARQAPLPITTGNSYSASGALWAAHDALLRMRLLPRPRSKERVKFKAMVVGATGAIGAACARLLVRAAEEVYLVSPETAKLLALKAAIEQESPGAKVVLAATTGRDLPQMDMVVTATSGAGKKVLDIMKAKPGCVITDVARPLDLSPEDVAKRPDVLVIESGEIRLPGEPRMKNIGLP
nr:dehydrogenase [Burkholderiaceae bacterium]